MAVQPDVGNKLIGWLLVGAGTVLTYSAFRNRSPWDVIRDIQGEPLTASTSSGPNGFANPDATPTDFSSSVPRIRQVANREIPPVLVAIKPHGQLDKDAAASWERVNARVGRPVNHVGAYKSWAAQAADYYGNNSTMADGSPRFGHPDKSLHVVGLAIDVASADIATAKPFLTAEGWQNPRPDAEPWHWSYLVRG